MFNLKGELGHKVEANDISIAKRISEVLMKHYNGHAWAVHVNSEGGVIDVKALNISEVYGVRMLYRDVVDDPEMKKIKMMAGELLERAGLRRGKYNPGEQIKHLEGASFQDNLMLELGITR